MKSTFLNRFYILAVLLTSTFVYAEYIPPEPLPADTLPIPRPEEVKIDYLHDGYSQTFTMAFEKLFDIAGHIKSLTDNPKQAMNLNAFDGVDNSTWFTNRNVENKMSIDSFAKGPDTEYGPDTTGTWLIIRAKAEGITPGFTIKDKRGGTYVIKFDPPGYSELATGAEVVVTKLFYGMGYNVPENYITIFDPSMLVLGDDVTLVDEKGRKRKMNENDVKEILTRIEFLPNGKIRALASKYVEGRPVGGFRYEKTRKDDPNDIIPHEHRRELRGLEVPCSWLKHFDTKAGNNLDTYVGEKGKGHLKHFLIDFGSTLGSAAFAPQDPYKGHELDLDFQVMAANVITLGLVVKNWEKLDPPFNPAIGLFDAWDFDPSDTRPNFPNPAFANMTNCDGYWGAKLVMSITDDQLKAAIETGKYTDPDVKEYIFKILKERRDKSGIYWYNQVCPLDFFEIDEQINKAVLSFTDMGVRDGLWDAKDCQYSFSIKYGDRTLVKDKIVDTPNVPIYEYFLNVDVANGNRQVEIELRNKNLDSSFNKYVRVYLEPEGDSFKLLGIERKD